MRFSLVAQLVKNLRAMRETWVGSLGWENLLEKGKATHSSILAWRIPWTSPWGHKESDTTERLLLSLLCLEETGKKHCISEISFFFLILVTEYTQFFKSFECFHMKHCNKMDLAKSSFDFFHKMLRKNLNEIFGHLNTWSGIWKNKKECQKTHTHPCRVKSIGEKS